MNITVGTPQHGEICWFSQVVPIIIVIIGFIGNTFIAIILRGTQYSDKSTCYYMQVLAWSDNCIMVLLFTRWLSKLPNGFMIRDTYFCILYFYCVSTFFGISAWILVAMALDRYISVRFPLKTKSICTISRARVTLLVILLVNIIHHLPYFWRHRNPNGGVSLMEKCPYDLSPTFKIIYEILFRVVFDRILPWLVILGLTIAMTYQLYTTKNKTLLAKSQKGADDAKVTRRVTTMSLGVACMYFVLTFPVTIHEYGRVIGTLWIPKYVHESFVYLKYLNSAINFYLYILVAKQFRHEALEVLYRAVGKEGPRGKGKHCLIPQRNTMGSVEMSLSPKGSPTGHLARR